MPSSPDAAVRPLRLLVVGSETPSQKDARRERSGASSAESYGETLRSMRPDASIEIMSCLDAGEDWTPERVRRFDGVIFAGSPIQMHEETNETRRAAAFGRLVFESGRPSFGSCAGLQIAVVAAGGAVKPRQPGTEAAFVRRISATDEGRAHPMLAGRPPAWDALAMHSSEVSRLPDGGHILAGSAVTFVQAVEIRHRGGTFWGVQYHPELTLAEIAASLRSQGEDLIEEGLARTPGEVEDYAALIDALHAEPGRPDLAWRLGLDREVTEPARRLLEIENFLCALAAPPPRAAST